jgi:trans-aconitate methyltransferase
MTNQWNAAQYDAKHAFVYEKAKGVVELLAPQAGERILDVGCETGALTAGIAERFAEILGVDQSQELISQGEKKSAAEVEVLDARQLRFSAEFDAVFSNAVLHWIPEAEPLIAGVTQALKFGGRFVAEFLGKGNIRRLMEGFYRVFVVLEMREPEACPLFFTSIAERAGLLGRHGLEVRKRRCSIGRRCWKTESADWKTGFACSGRLN